MIAGNIQESVVSTHLVLQSANLGHDVLSSINGSTRFGTGVELMVFLGNLVNDLSNNSRPPFGHSLISIARFDSLALRSDGCATNEKLNNKFSV